MSGLRILALLLICTSCATMPKVKHSWHKFPKKAYLGKPDRPFDVLGEVKMKVNFVTLDIDNEETQLCRNYYNQAVKKLLQLAQKNGGDAVADVKSVVFYLDGSWQLYPEPECSDDGAEGQILVRGVAIRFKKPSRSM